LKKYNQYSYSDLVSIVWISLCGFLFSYGYSKFIDYQYGLDYSISLAAGTFIIYSVSNIKSLKKQLGLSLLNVLAFFIAAYYSLLVPLNTASILVLGFSFAISVLYVTPPSKNKLDIRSIPSLKILIIAFVWVTSCIVIPALNKQIDVPWLLCIAIGMFYISIIIPFDIRDVREDDKRLKTFPQIFGIKRSKRLALTLILLSFVIVLYLDLPLLFKLLYGIDVLFIVLLITLINRILYNKIYFILLDGTVLILGLSFILSK
jgi:hypothetical protein